MTSISISGFLLGKHFVGIEHFSLPQEEWFAVLSVEKKTEGLVITDKIVLQRKDNELIKWKTSLPHFLIVNSSQVIQKEVLDVNISDEKLLYKAFPNLNSDDFYYEITRLKTKSLVAISRKIYLDELLFNYKTMGLSIAGFSLGVCTFSEIINYTEETTFFTNHQIINCDEENQIIETSSNIPETIYNINGLNIANNYLLAFSGIVRLLAGTSNSGNSIDYSIDLYDNYKQDCLFSKGLKMMIGFVLVVLIINFFFFTHYYKLSQDTSESLVVHKSSIEVITKIKGNIILKEKKLNKVLEITSLQSSFFINEITRRIPQSILLTELIYHPLQKKVKTEEPILIDEKIITLTGTTIDNTSFTLWIEGLEQLKWIDQVVITHFGKNEQNITEFSIKLTLREDESK